MLDAAHNIDILPQPPSPSGRGCGERGLKRDNGLILHPLILAFSTNRYIHSTVTPGLQVAIVFSIHRDFSDSATGRI
jgi:hypothetical protein